MAWYALYKWFGPWRKIPYQNWIKWYRGYLYERWYNSLTDEQKEKLNRLREEKKQKRKREMDVAFAELSRMLGYMYDKSGLDYMAFSRDYFKDLNSSKSKYW